MKRHNLYYSLAILIFSITSAALSFAESPVSLVEKGNTAYNAGNYDEALSAYDAAAKERPSDARIEFNRGAAFFRKGELDKAKDAWEKAALGATDVPMEAESLYNLGTLEFLKLRETQTPDPKAALEAGDRSVRYYHEAKDLLANSLKYKNNPLVREASENIELVRRSMKTIQEEMARREEAAKNQAQAAEDLKNLIEEQQELNQRTEGQAEKSPEENPPEAGQPEQNQAGQQENAPLGDMAREQSQLQEETQKTAEKLAGSDAASPSNQTSAPPTQDPAQAAKDHLADAQARQKDAADKLTAGQASEAAKDQEAALEKMKNALDLLQNKDDQNKDSQGQNDQKQQNQSSDSANQTDQGQGEKKPAPQPQQDQTDQQGQDAAGNPENPPDPAADAPMVQLPDDAERILGEEKENKKVRRQVSGTGGYQDVDKDW
jgi:hypothetical protein